MERRLWGYLISGLLVVFLAALATGCNGSSEDLSWKFTFEQGTEGWSGDFVDLPVDYEADIYELEFAHADLPEELSRAGKALMLSGHNRSDDLFMYLKKKLTAADGLEPGGTYLVRIEVEFATNAPAGAVGIGGAPGEAVWMKLGAASEEPVPEVTDAGSDHPYYRLSVDKGSQNDDGAHALRIGNVAKESGDDESYALKNLDNMEQPLRATADAQGNLWVFVGTDSGFEGKTTLYYTGINIILEKV